MSLSPTYFSQFRLPQLWGKDVASLITVTLRFRDCSLTHSPRACASPYELRHSCLYLSATVTSEYATTNSYSVHFENSSFGHVAAAGSLNLRPAQYLFIADHSCGWLGRKQLYYTRCMSFPLATARHHSAVSSVNLY